MAVGTKVGCVALFDAQAVTRDFGALLKDETGWKPVVRSMGILLMS